MSPLLEMASAAIWVTFIVEFGVKFLLAPRKLDNLKGDWLMAVAPFAPAARVF
jgi:voltage-gated potassium channel